MNQYVKGFWAPLHERLVRESIEYPWPCMITGPCGTGKSTLAIAIARELGRAVEVFHLGCAIDVEAALLGAMVLIGGETRFVRSRFIEAVTRPGTVIVLDELSRAGASAQSVLLSLLDFQRRIVLDLEPPGRRVVELAPGVCFIATCNLGAEYVGTEPLDLALTDRTVKVRMGYSESERELLLHGGRDPARVKRILALGKAVREQHARGALSAGISTRGLVHVAQLVDRGFAVEEAFEAVVGVFSDEELAALRTTLRGAEK